MKRKWGLTVVLALVCVMLLGIGVAATTFVVGCGTCGDNLEWVLEDNGKLTISGTGTMHDYTATDKAPWDSYKNSYSKTITSLVMEEGITSVGNYAFDSCSKLTSVALPDSLISIGKCAFSDCSRLTSLKLPERLTYIDDQAFSNCTGLTSVIFPSNLTSIKECAFCGCANLSGITFSDNLSFIGDYAFSDCSALSSIVLPQGLVSIGDYAFIALSNLTSIEFPENLTTIGSGAFNDCSQLTEITLNSDISAESNPFLRTNLRIVHIANTVSTVPYAICSTSTITEFDVNDTDDIGLVSIDNVLYSYDDFLETYTLVRYPAAKENLEYNIIDNTEIIGENAFRDCNFLQRINIPDTVQTIGNYAFANCGKLSTLRWGAGVTTMGTTSSYIFSYSSAKDSSPITNIILPENPRTIPQPSTVINYEVITDTGIGYKTIDGVLFSYDGKQVTLIEYPNGRSDTEYVIPDETHVIGRFAFDNNKYISNIVFSDSVISIEDAAFDGCSAIEYLTLPDSLITIDYKAFAYCSGLKAVQFSSVLTEINDYAFLGCTYLKEVFIPKSVVFIGKSAFDKCNALRRAYFYGNAPSISSNYKPFSNTHSPSRSTISKANPVGLRLRGTATTPLRLSQMDIVSSQNLPPRTSSPMPPSQTFLPALQYPRSLNSSTTPTSP